MKHAHDLYMQGERNTAVLLQAVTKMIESEPLSNIDYIEMYRLPGLLPVDETISGKVLLAVAVKFGTTRLIDNVILGDE